MILWSSIPPDVMTSKLSAYWRLHIFPNSPSQTPCKMLELNAWENIVPKMSVTKINRRGESGSPCLSSRRYQMYPHWDPFTKILALEEKSKALIHSICRWPNPRAANNSRRKSQSTISNAFEKSTLSTWPGILRFCKLKINSSALIILSRMQRPLINTDYDGSSKELMTRRRLEAKILDTILSKELIRLISL